MAACINSTFLFIAEQCYHCMDISQFLHSLVDGHSGCFHLGTITNKATMNICVQVFTQAYVSFLLGK